jgi:hypothetical protein
MSVDVLSVDEIYRCGRGALFEPPAGGVALPPGEDEPEPTVPWTCVRSTRWDDEPDARACSHCAMV